MYNMFCRNKYKFGKDTDIWLYCSLHILIFLKSQQEINCFDYKLNHFDLYFELIHILIW